MYAKGTRINMWEHDKSCCFNYSTGSYSASIISIPPSVLTIECNGTFGFFDMIPRPIL